MLKMLRKCKLFSNFLPAINPLLKIKLYYIFLEMFQRKDYNISRFELIVGDDFHAELWLFG